MQTTDMLTSAKSRLTNIGSMISGCGVLLPWMAVL